MEKSIFVNNNFHELLARIKGLGGSGVLLKVLQEIRFARSLWDFLHCSIEPILIRMTFTLHKKEILMDILLRLPAKSLVRFLSTCKSLSNLIGSLSFVREHLNRNVTKHVHVYLLCPHHPNFECPIDRDDPYAKQELRWSLFSYETFEQCFHLSHPLESKENYSIYGSSNGLVCISDVILNFKSHIHIYNPSIRKFRTLPISTNNMEFGYIALQFGFHPTANDYKAVRMMLMDKNAFAVQVYSLRRDSWKMIDVIPPWLKCSWQHHNGTFFNGIAYQIIEKGPIFTIMSFDSDTEEFEEFIAPDTICSSWKLCIDAYKEQICLLFNFYCCEEEGLEIGYFWVLNENQWKEMSHFIYPSEYQKMGISIDNELLMGKTDLIGGAADLYLCNYESNQVRETGIKLAVMEYDGNELFFAITYVESLVLIN